MSRFIHEELPDLLALARYAGRTGIVKCQCGRQCTDRNHFLLECLLPTVTEARNKYLERLRKTLTKIFDSPPLADALMRLWTDDAVGEPPDLTEREKRAFPCPQEGASSTQTLPGGVTQHVDEGWAEATTGLAAFDYLWECRQQVGMNT